MMNRPHEETWNIDDNMVESGDFSVTDEEGFCVISAYSSLDGEIGDAQALARIRLASASPEMAREIIGVLDGVSLSPLRAAKLTAVLKKAGVL